MGFENSDSDTGRLISMFWNKLAFELRVAVMVRISGSFAHAPSVGSSASS